MEINIIYADGSSAKRENKRCGGIGIYFENTKDEICKSFTNDNPTNQRMELQACLTAIKLYIKQNKNFSTNKELIIRTDSMYSINCITNWSNKWKDNNWKRKVGKKDAEVLHLDLIKELYELYHDQKYKIKFEHVKAHQKRPDKQSDKWNQWYGNYMADKLASDAMERCFQII